MDAKIIKKHKWDSSNSPLLNKKTENFFKEIKKKKIKNFFNCKNPRDAYC